jgi:hypothetical protein
MIYYHCSQNRSRRNLISDAVFFESIAKLGERFASDTTLENEWKPWF